MNVWEAKIIRRVAPQIVHDAQDFNPIPKGPKYHCSRSLVGFLAPKVYTMNYLAVWALQIEMTNPKASVFGPQKYIL